MFYIIENAYNKDDGNISKSAVVSAYLAAILIVVVISITIYRRRIAYRCYRNRDKFTEDEDKSYLEEMIPESVSDMYASQKIKSSSKISCYNNFDTSKLSSLKPPLQTLESYLKEENLH